MSIKSILLAVSGGVVVLALIYLSMEVRAAPPPVPAAKIEEARGKAKKTRAAPSPSNVSDPWGASTAEKNAMAEAKTEPAPAPEPQIEEPAVEPEVNTMKTAPVPDVDNDPRLELSTAKDEVNRLYDKQDYEGALANGIAVLAKEPGDIRMLRVVVSAACQLGDADKAQQYWAQLPPHDQSQMTRRCQRFGIAFKE